MTEITEIRFKLPAAKNVAYDDLDDDGLRTSIEAETAGVKFPPRADAPEGAALADIIIVAIITGGSTVAAAAITAYVNYLISHQTKPENNIVIRLRGIVGSETVQLSSDKQANKKAIKAAVKRLKVITHVALVD